MKEFHAQRVAGVTDAEALHAAAARIRGSERWDSPYFWGPFLYVGL
jgi:CHAT domain-containing protein